MGTSLPDYMLISDTDGGLYDTRQDGWASKAVRPNYCVHNATINSLADLKASIRAGGYTLFGGYPMYFFTGDGSTYAFETVRQKFEIFARCWEIDGPGRIAGCAVNYESDLYDELTGAPIESAER